MPRIDGFKLHHLSTPIVPPRRTGNHVYEALENVLLELSSDGVVGQGYAFSFNRRHAAAIAILTEDLAEAVVGREVGEFRRIWHDLWHRINFIGQAGPPVKALSIVDMAVWDLFARQLGKPVWHLLGPLRDTIELYPTGGYLTDPIEEVIAEVTGFRDAGYGACKIKIGRPDWATDVARVAALREAVGPDFGIMVDVNQSWDVATAITAGRELAALGVTWFEEPVSIHDLDGMARVAEALDMPVIAGESSFARPGLLPYLQMGACRNLMLNMMRVGGPTEFMRVAAAAETYNIPVSSHTFTETSAQLLAALPNGTLAEYVPGWWDPLFEEPLDIRRGVLHLHDRPGFGRSFAQDVIRKYAV